MDEWMDGKSLNDQLLFLCFRQFTLAGYNVSYRSVVPFSSYYDVE